MLDLFAAQPPAWQFWIGAVTGALVMFFVVCAIVFRLHRVIPWTWRWCRAYLRRPVAERQLPRTGHWRFRYKRLVGEYERDAATNTMTLAGTTPCRVLTLPHKHGR